MTVEETLKIMAVLKASYPTFYKDMNRTDAESIVNLWAEMFAEDDYRLVAAAVKVLIATDSKGFPPVIGQVKCKLNALQGAKSSISDVEAWNLVSKAIKNGIWGAKREFDALPESVKKIVGSPQQLTDWAKMSEESVHSVVASNFQRSYRAKVAEEKEYAALPPDVRRMIEGQAYKPQIEGGD